MLAFVENSQHVLVCFDKVSAHQQELAKLACTSKMLQKLSLLTSRCASLSYYFIVLLIIKITIPKFYHFAYLNHNPDPFYLVLLVATYVCDSKSYFSKTRVKTQLLQFQQRGCASTIVKLCSTLTLLLVKIYSLQLQMFLLFLVCII